MFDRNHFIWIGICSVFVIGMLICGKRSHLSLRAASRIMVVISVFSETGKILSEMQVGLLGGMSLSPRALPFHLCSLMLFGVLYIAFGREGKAKQAVIDFVAVMGTLGSIAAILIPTNGTDFTSIFSYQCFVYHGGLLWFSLYLILHKDARLGIRAYFRNLGMLLLIVWFTFYLNGALSAYGTNFMFLVRPPMENLPYLNLNHGWYIYFLRLILLGTGLISLFQLPFMIHERTTARGTARGTART